MCYKDLQITQQLTYIKHVDYFMKSSVLNESYKI